MVLTVSSSNINKTINKKVKYNLKFYHTRKRENCYTSTHIMYIIWIYMELCSIYCAVDIAEFWKKFQSWTSEVLWVIWEPGKSAGWGRILVPLASECFWCYQLHHTLFISVTGTWNSSPRDHNSWVAREEKTRLLRLTTTLVSSCRIQSGFLQSKVIDHIPVWESGSCPCGRHSRLATVTLQRELATKLLLLSCCIHVLFLGEGTVYWS